MNMRIIYVFWGAWVLGIADISAGDDHIMETVNCTRILHEYARMLAARTT